MSLAGSSTSSSTSNTNSAAPTPSTRYREQLITYCRNNRLPRPTWAHVSDQRGGRTAWSANVTVNGRSIAAKFWYDGNRTSQADEDAAQRALMELGQLPRPQFEVPPHLQHMYTNGSVRVSGA